MGAALCASEEVLRAQTVEPIWAILHQGLFICRLGGSILSRCLHLPLTGIVHSLHMQVKLLTDPALGIAKSLVDKHLRSPDRVLCHTRSLIESADLTKKWELLNLVLAQLGNGPWRRSLLPANSKLLVGNDL